jgi:sorbitol-specific phosphotransferase system component IIBC
MRICWRAIAVASAAFLIASGPLVADETEPNDPNFDMFASMAGQCSALKVGGHDFVCTTVAFFHSPGGRSSFTVPLNDPADASHIITFSGEKSKREKDNLYELTVDKMLLKSKDRPKVDGLPVPAVVSASGTCRQVGNFATKKVSTVSCSAADETGKKYQFRFESDGSPIRVQMIRVADLAAEERRAKLLAANIEQIKCRLKADAQGILRRDRTDFILRCMEE